LGFFWIFWVKAEIRGVAGLAKIAFVRKLRLVCGLTLRGEFLEERVDAGVEVDLALLAALHHGGEGCGTGADSLRQRGEEQWQDGVVALARRRDVLVVEFRRVEDGGRVCSDGEAVFRLC